MTHQTSARDLSGWTVTGGPGSRGRAVPPLPGGGVDWSRPRCEPDNRPHVVLGRLLAVAVPLLAALPAMWFGLPLSERLGIRAADWLTGHGLSAWLLVTGPVGLLLVLAGVTGLVRSGRPFPARAASSARVRVDVTATQAPESSSGMYPAGQLVFRVFDSPALQPASVEPTQGPTVLEGRWSA
jgi:hypothetical protein